MFGNAHYPRVAMRQAGPQTTSGPGDTIIDTNGRRYRVVDWIEAASIRNSTAGHVYELHPDGTIR